MRIAFVDNLPVGGGLSRFSYMLCQNLVEYYPEIEIDYFTHVENLKRTPELLNLSTRVKIKVLRTTLAPSLGFRFVSRLGLLMRQSLKRKSVMQEIESCVKTYDVAYFPSAHMMPCPRLSVPIVGTVHDFNWKYFFGRQIFSEEFVNEMDGEVVKWMTTATTACSSHDVVNEATKLYPGLKKYPEVVHIGPVTFSKEVAEDDAQKILKALGITYPYIIFPGNFFPHKNHLNLFSAFSLLKKRSGFADLKLILTGMKTDQLSFGIAEKNGVQLVAKPNNPSDFDVRGLGYQPNAVIDSLISKAKLLVSPSLYEAICTPGMDAWGFGTPTAISNIAPFKEHESVLGIRSAYFDPMDPNNIADVLEQYLNDDEKRKEDAIISKRAMAQYSWKQVADGYFRIFNAAISLK